MATEVGFVIFNRPDNVKSIEMDIPPGMSVEELAEHCAALPEVTATKKELIVSSCMVDNAYWSLRRTFTGDEKKVIFLELLRGG